MDDKEKEKFGVIVDKNKQSEGEKPKDDDISTKNDDVQQKVVINEDTVPQDQPKVDTNVQTDQDTTSSDNTSTPSITEPAEKVNETQGGIVIVKRGALIAKLELPIAGLLSDKRANIVAEENIILKDEWSKAGCTLPYMGFNLLPLSVIPNFRITNKGLVDVNTMKLIPLFE